MLSKFGSEKKSDSPLIHFNFCFFKAHHCVFELHVTPFLSGTLHYKDSWAECLQPTFIFVQKIYFCYIFMF